MAIQIFGTKKCKDTQKAVRFFKERRINIHFIDLNEKGMSPGELDSVCRTYAPETLIDSESKEYQRLNLKHMVFDPKEILLENPLLIKTPIARNGKIATVGFVPEAWKDWK